MSEVKDDNEIPVMLVELVDQRDSGFVKDGTENTPYEEKLTAPSVSWIPTQGSRLQRYEEDGVTLLKTPYYEKIRWVKGELELSLAKQRKLGIEPENGKGKDYLVFEKGYFTVAREGSDIGLYDYLKQCSYNESNPDRNKRATAIFKVIEQDKETEIFNEDEMASADALQFVGTLYSKVGDRQYKYHEDKINGMCSLLNIYSETNAGKIQQIIVYAKNKPKDFMNLVAKWQNTTVTEVTQALTLNVIKFDGNVAMYTAKDKVLFSLGTEKMNQNQKITKLADKLRTSDGHEAYMELKAEIEAAQEKTLK